MVIAQRNHGRKARSSAPLLKPGWPVFGVLYGFLVLWLLGLSALIWPIAAVPMALRLWSRRNVYVPRGFGLWILFLGWVLLSAANIDAATDGLLFAYRASIYVSVGIILLYVYNLPTDEVPSRRLVNALAFFWASVVLMGLVATLLPTVRFQSALEVLLPGSITSIGFVEDLIHPVLARVHDFLGFPVARPAAPFAFANHWGSVVALMAPMFWLWTQRQTSRVARTGGIVLLVVALIPVVQSLNRGLWLSISVAVVYAAVRFALQGRARWLIAIGLGVALLALLIAVSPLRVLVSARADEGHSDETRVDLIGKSLDATWESPLLGHGGPIPDEQQLELAAVSASEGGGWSPPPIGTHGQLWFVLVSHGIPAAALFCAFLLYALWTTRGPLTSPTVFWSHVTILVACAQVFFYPLLPAQLPLLGIVIAMAIRELSPPSRPMPRELRSTSRPPAALSRP